MVVFTFSVDLVFSREYVIEAPTFEEAYNKLEAKVDDFEHHLRPGDVSILGVDVVDEQPSD